MMQSKSILLVEDDKDDQEFFIEALKDIKNVTLYYVANNGKEALDKLKNSTVLPDLIFTDINMPVMNGIECLTAIINDPQTRNIPVVILTTDTARLEQMHSLGAKAFIKKTFDGKALRSQLEQMIGMDLSNNNQAANQTFQAAFLANKAMC